MRLCYCLFFVVACVPGLDGQQLPPCSIETIAGAGFSLHGDDGPAIEADLLDLRDIAMGADDSYYLADRLNRSIWRVFTDQHIEALPGAGTLELPSALAISGDGTVYYAEAFGRRILRLNTDGSTNHIAGNGSGEFSGDGGPAIQAGIGNPRRMAVGPDGSLYFVVTEHQRVRRIRPDGVIETFAGSGPAQINEGHYTGDGIPAVEARLNQPEDVLADDQGRVYIADTGNFRIRVVDSSGRISTVAGNGQFLGSGDGLVAAENGIGWVRALALEPDGRLLYYDERGGFFQIDDDGLMASRSRFTSAGANFVVDSMGRIHRVFVRSVSRLDANDLRETVAGAQNRGLFGADGTPAAEVPLTLLSDLAVDTEGRIYAAESLQRARRIEADGTIATYSAEANGSVVASAPDGSVYTGASNFLFRVAQDGTTERFLSSTGGPLEIWGLRDVTVDSAGKVYLVYRPRGTGLRSGNLLGVVGEDRRIGIELIPPDDGNSSRTRMEPELIAVDSQDRLVVLVDPPGQERLLMRWDPAAATWETLLKTSDFMAEVGGLAVGPDDRIYLTENSFGTIWVLTPDGVLDVIAGDRETVTRRSGDGGPASEARFWGVRIPIAASLDGHLYLDDGDAIRRINRVSECDVRRRPVPARFGTVNGASFWPGIATGQIFSIFGRDLGPDELATTRLVDGRLATELARTRVLIDGIPAPLIFVSKGQISGVAPYGALAGKRRNEAGVLVFDEPTPVAVEHEGVTSTPHPIYIGQAGPGLFTADSSGGGLAAALNEDGSVNSPGNPAQPGSVVVLFGTGEGPTDPPGVDGKPAGLPLPRPILPIRLTVNGQEAVVIYAGGAPGFTAGLLQLNVRLPDTARGTVEIALFAGQEQSRVVTFEVAP